MQKWLSILEGSFLNSMTTKILHDSGLDQYNAEHKNNAHVKTAKMIPFQS